MAIITLKANADGLLGADSQFSIGFIDTTKEDNIIELIDAASSLTDPALNLASVDSRALLGLEALIDAMIDTIEFGQSARGAYAVVNRGMNAVGGIVLSVDNVAIPNKNKFAQALDALRAAVMRGTMIPDAS